MGTTVRVVVLGFAAALGCALNTAQAQDCTPSPGTNREVVLQFYQSGLVERNPRAAFEQHVSPDLVEHKPDVPGGRREDVIRYLEDTIRMAPEGRWEILRTVAEGDLVFLHAKFTPAPGAPAYAIADLFRLENCRIVEHWDVVAGPPPTQSNPNSRF